MGKRNPNRSQKRHSGSYIYSPKEFEKGKTHDELWTKFQQIFANNRQNSRIFAHVWGKKKDSRMVENAEEALGTAIIINDNYALDGNDPNGYVGVHWSIGGIHDRPFSNIDVVLQVKSDT